MSASRWVWQLGRIPRRTPGAMAAVLSLALLLAQAPVALAAAYTYDCSGVHQPTHDIVDKDVTAQTYYIKGVIGDVTNKNLDACGAIGGNFGSEYDVPWVFAANLQDFNAITQNIVQIGYGRCEIANCVIPNDGNQHLVYTINDNASGVMANAEAWYHALVDNHRYRMKIELITCGGSKCWQYSVKDVSIGEAYVSHTTSFHWTGTGNLGGNFSWWGAETNNVNSQMGVKDTQANFNMDYMQYLTTAAGAQWTVRQGMSACDLPEGQPNGYHCAINTTVYTKDTLVAWTTPH